MLSRLFLPLSMSSRSFSLNHRNHRDNFNNRIISTGLSFLFSYRHTPRATFPSFAPSQHSTTGEREFSETLPNQITSTPGLSLGVGGCTVCRSLNLFSRYPIILHACSALQQHSLSHIVPNLTRLWHPSRHDINEFTELD